jgi:hypothetical protein
MSKIKLENIVKVQIVHEHQLNKTDNFCRICGLPVTVNDIKTTLVCSECRHIVSDTDLFCGNCGGDLSGIVKNTEHYFTGAIGTTEFNLIKEEITKKKGVK